MNYCTFNLVIHRFPSRFSPRSTSQTKPCFPPARGRAQTLQKFLRIHVSMNRTRSIASSPLHGLAGISGPWVTRISSALCEYHLVDILALLAGEYPHPCCGKNPHTGVQTSRTFFISSSFIYIKCGRSFMTIWGTG
jgi:hypothetical protein